jgi:Protein of unknown function (DUF1269)
MSELIVVGFNDPEEADRVLLRLSKLRKEYLIDIEDAVVVVRDEDGKVHLKQGVNLVTAGATTGFVSGSLWGTLVGFLFLNPLAGFVLGSAIGVGAGALPAPCPTTASMTTLSNLCQRPFRPTRPHFLFWCARYNRKRFSRNFRALKGGSCGPPCHPSRRKSFNKLLKTPHPPQVDGSPA